MTADEKTPARLIAETISVYDPATRQPVPIEEISDEHLDNESGWLVARLTIDGIPVWFAGNTHTGQVLSQPDWTTPTELDNVAWADEGGTSLDTTFRGWSALTKRHHAERALIRLAGELADLRIQQRQVNATLNEAIRQAAATGMPLKDIARHANVDISDVRHAIEGT